MSLKPFSYLLGIIGSIFCALFGRFNWNSPPWLTHLNQKIRSTPMKFWGSSVTLLILSLALAYGIYWYKNLPQPVLVTALITVPTITPNTDPLIPIDLTIDFGINDGGFTYQSVAPIHLIGKILTEGIDISPKIQGKWIWVSDSQLIFRPSEDWPAGQKFTIHTEKNFFAPQAKMKSHVFSFNTLPFQANLVEYKFYQDPVHADKHQAVATLEFNFPVDTNSLEKYTSLAFQALKEGDRNLKAQSIGFTYTYDEQKRVAYLHSDNIKIQDVARYLLLTLSKKVKASTGSAHLETELSKSVFIPDSSNFLKINATTANIIRNSKDRPEQVLTVETTLGVNENEFNKSVHFYLLPQDYPASALSNAKPHYQWQNPGEITPAILALSTPLTKEAIPTEQNYSSLHSFKFAAQTPQFIYVKIDKGMKSFGDFKLSNDYQAVIPVPEYPKEISFLHKGSLLALSGEKKLSVLTRGLPAVKFEFARVLPENINQLVTQTQGDFNNPYFINPSFNQQNISEISSEVKSFDASDLTKQQYTALDLNQYLKQTTNSTGPQGLFLLQATGWDEVNKEPLDVKSSRLVLLTDLGLLVKDNNDGTHDVFVQSITQGTPVPNVKVTVLGKNGLPILTQTTDEQGRANIPTLKFYVDDKEPTVYLASLNNDVSFIPFYNNNRQLNYSKFDVGGLYSNNQDAESLSAYLFSERGIYRPGDTVHVGMIVKQAYVQPQAAGLPLKVTVVDARGTVIKDQKLVLNETGYLDLDFTTTGASPTGIYTVSLYLVKDNRPQNLLGSTTVRILEFQPDRMRITSELLPKPADGWSSPTGLTAKVSLWNLYGSPATDRRISAKLLLTPQALAFDQYPDYVFSDPLQDPKKPAKVFSETLTDIKTNDKGDAVFELNLDRFEKATYQLTFFAEGFEADGGRSVTSQVKTLVSPLPYFIGYKPDGDLSFIQQNSARSIHVIGINPQLTHEAVKDLKIQLISLHPVTTLVKKPDGAYQYQSIIQSSVISTTAFPLDEKGATYSLPTQQIGDYAIHLLGNDETVLNQLKFSVVGSSQSPLAKNAELSIKLNQSEYKAGEDIAIQITAPYTGSGLITIERDKVYATQWFKTDSTNSLQTIHIPADFEGNGYVNVAFIRDWDSPELMISPLSYSVQPFDVTHEKHDIKIELNNAKVARPGEPFTIDYHSDNPGKIIVFAVDEGILQVSHYETPDPLAFFFEKYALQVATQQTVDQILPKFIQDRELSAAGGDGSEGSLAGRLNPFKRKTDLPVVYWSGIIDTDATTRQLTYNVPDYFNGRLRIMAVAVSKDRVGATETSAEIRGDFIINPNVPTFVAPGDEFEISSTVANNVKDSGDHSEITIELTSSPEIEVIGKSKQHLDIAEGHEKTVRYTLRATKHLGAGKVTIRASAGAKTSTMDTTLSVRPANPFMTSIQSGQSTNASNTLNVIQTLYPEYRTVEATLSRSPLILVFGLQRYLENFPYGCTEQLTSKAMPLLAMNANPWFIKDTEQTSKKINDTIQMLSQRQMSSGGFSYWPGLGDNQGNAFSSVYAMHFLTQAREQGFNVPEGLFFSGLGYLKDLASQNATDKEFARTQAYAIYVLTRNEMVTTNYLVNLQITLQKDPTNAWKKDITGAYIAASYQLLKSEKEANQLISQYVIQNKPTKSSLFHDNEIANAQYLYLIAKHFPARLHEVGDQLLLPLVQAMNNDEINTLLASYSSLAFSAYDQGDSNASSSALSMTELLADNAERNNTANQQSYLKLILNTDVNKVRFNNPDKQVYFYQLAQSGFDKAFIKKPIKQGMEIYREYTDEKGAVITSTTLGDEIEVHLHIRGLNNDYLNNIAIEDLLPGGFEVVSDSVKTQGMDYADAREDRVIFFGGIELTAKEIVYKIKAINIGKYTVPPAYAEAMYNPMTKARSTTSEITVLRNQ